MYLSFVILWKIFALEVNLDGAGDQVSSKNDICVIPNGVLHLRNICNELDMLENSKKIWGINLMDYANIEYFARS